LAITNPPRSAVSLW